MSTASALSGEFGTASKARSLQDPADSIFPMVLTYALATILIFLAARGTPSFLFPTAANGMSVDSEGGPLKNVLVVAAFATMCIVMIPMYKVIWRSVLQYPVLLLLPVWATSSIIWSQIPIRSLAAGLQATILTLFGFYIALRLKPRQQMQLFVFVGLMTTLLSFAIAVLYPSAGIDYKNSTIGVEGLFPQKNICAVITIELLTVGFCYKFRGPNGRLKRSAFVFLLISLILVTLARTGWILLTLVVVFIALLRVLHKLRPLERFTVIWFLPAVGAVLGWLVYDNSAAILHLLGKDPSLSGRTGIWAVVFLAIVKRPLAGFGYAAFWIANTPEATRLSIAAGDAHLNNAENGVLQLWLELGLIGVLILLFLLVRSCRNAVRCFRRNTPNYAIWYMSILFITLLSLVDGNKFMLWTSIEWVMFIMADVGLANEARRVRLSAALAL